MLVKGEIKRVRKRSLFHKLPPGPFYNQKRSNLSVMTNVIYDEEDDIEINVKYICSCDNYVYQMNVDGSFACTHCDSVCTEKVCVVCESLNDKDLWSDANL